MIEPAPYKFDKIQAIVLGIPSAICVLFACLYIFDETYGQWSSPYGWASANSAHGGYLFVMIPWILSFLLVVAIGGWWLSNAQNDHFPHRKFAAWIAFLIFSAVIYYPSNEQYAAITVLIMGPGHNSIKFQQNAAQWDSVVLIDALLARNAKIGKYIACHAQAWGSRAVLARLAKDGFKPEDCR